MQVEWENFATFNQQTKRPFRLSAKPSGANTRAYARNVNVVVIVTSA